MTVQNGTEQDPRFNAEHSTPMEQPVLPPYVQLYKSPQRGYFLPTIPLHSQFTSLYLRILFLQLQYLQHIYWFSTCEKSYWLGIFSRGKDWWIIPLVNSIWLAEGVETVSLEACCFLSSSFKLEAIILSTRRMGVKALNLATQATQMN